MSTAAVQQSGNITPGHIPIWTASGVLSDGGSNGQYAPSYSQLTVPATVPSPFTVTLYTIPRVAFFFVSAPVAIAYAGNSAINMGGTITAYDPNTGLMSVLIQAAQGGSYTASNWTVSLSSAWVIQECEALITATNGATTVASYSAFRALSATTYPVVFMQGYYTPGDGGGGFFVYVPSDTTSADNGGTILTDSRSPTPHRYYRIGYGESVSPLMFGAKGDATTNDFAAWQAAINAAAASYANTALPPIRIIDGNGLKYYMGTSSSAISGLSITTNDITIRNARFDFSGWTGANQGFINCSGVQATGVSLTSALAAGNATVSMASTSGYSANSLVFLSSGAVWDNSLSTPATIGQYGRVSAINNSATLTLFDNVLMSFSPSDPTPAVISLVTPITNVLFERLTLIGNNVNGSRNAGIWINLADHVRVNECNFEKIDYVSCAFVRCYKCSARDSHVFQADYVGYAYGFGVWQGCYHTTIEGCTGEDCRHTVTIGDFYGINLFTTVTGCHAISSKDAGFDSHSTSMYTTFSNNKVEMSSVRFASSNHDGMIVEGLHAVFEGNTVIGPQGNGIAHTPQNTLNLTSSCVITGNKIVLSALGYANPSNSVSSSASSHGIEVSLFAPISGSNASQIDGVTIANNIISGGTSNVNGAVGIQLEIEAPGGYINDVAISGNVTTEPMSANQALLLYANAANTSFTNVTVTGNRFWCYNSASGYGAEFLAGATPASISNVTFSGNVVTAPTGVAVTAQSLSTSVSGFTFSDNVITSHPRYGLLMLASTASSSISNIAGANNVIDAGTYNVYFDSPAGGGSISGVSLGTNVMLNSVSAGARVIPYAYNTGLPTSLYLADFNSLPPVTYSGSTITMTPFRPSAVFTDNVTNTVTLPNAGSYPGMYLNFRNVGPASVISSASDVVPVAGTSPGTAIVSASKWAIAQSNPTSVGSSTYYWYIQQAN